MRVFGGTLAHGTLIESGIANATAPWQGCWERGIQGKVSWQFIEGRVGAGVVWMGGRGPCGRPRPVPVTETPSHPRAATTAPTG